MPRAATELAKEWRMDRALRRLEAMIVAADAKDTLLISGTGDVIQPSDGVLAIGSGGNYALAAGPGPGRALVAIGRRDRPARRWVSRGISACTRTKTWWWRRSRRKPDVGR